MKKTWKYKTRSPRVLGDLCCIPLQCGGWAYVDAADIEIIAGWNWFSQMDSTGKLLSVRRSGGTGKPQLLLHREVMGLGPADPFCDHKNRRPADCTRENLRVASPRQNSQNTTIATNAVSNMRGVAPVRGKFRARIMLDRGRVHLGYYETARSAGLAYDQRAMKEFGEFAVLNFPKEIEPAI